MHAQGQNGFPRVRGMTNSVSAPLGSVILVYFISVILAKAGNPFLLADYAVRSARAPKVKMDLPQFAGMTVLVNAFLAFAVIQLS